MRGARTTEFSLPGIGASRQTNSTLSTNSRENQPPSSPLYLPPPCGGNVPELDGQRDNPIPQNRQADVTIAAKIAAPHTGYKRLMAASENAPMSCRFWAAALRKQANGL